MNQLKKSIFRIVSLNITQREVKLKEIRRDPFFKGAVVRSAATTLYINQNSPKEDRFKICKEIMMTIPIVMYTKKDFYLLDAINLKIHHLKAAGLVEFWHSQSINVGLLNVKNSNQPKVFSLEKLQGCFTILFYGSFLSLIVFLIEKCSFYLLN